MTWLRVPPYAPPVPVQRPIPPIVLARRRIRAWYRADKDKR